MKKFDLHPDLRNQLLQHTFEKLEEYYEHTDELEVLPHLNFEAIVKKARNVDFNTPLPPKKAIDLVIDGLRKYTLHSPHPKCFGLFVPRAAYPAVLADLITSIINPQLASWFHAAYAIEVERYLLLEFGQKFGYSASTIDGIFTSGGNEANLTSVLAALNHRFPSFAENGLIGISKQPIIYCSAEAHHSVIKAAKATGLGFSSVRKIEVKNDLKMDIRILRTSIEQDIAAGKQPLMIVGTAGTTGAGVIDDFQALKQIADEFKLWFHIDAAYGGAAALSPQLKPFLKGIEHSDSITFDAHKWISMPMGISMFITSKPNILKQTFSVRTTYVPNGTDEHPKVEPYAYSIQWSRRFMGLKLYLSLLIVGWEGFTEMINHQSNMGHYLRKKLRDNGWLIKNRSDLPVICFTDPAFESDDQFCTTVVQNIVASGRSWLSTYPIKKHLCIRTCISNYLTVAHDIDALIDELNEERKRYSAIHSKETSSLV